ncbi:30S ribosome-binding factor RbfA [Sedimentibacter sp. MB31-C6]|uniref:30S ribosome-binding factor RbfA n=1 Tax=Sedimentibacter sp. MB31-C6 TaxID=3109366 RepID=UPI002DDCD7B1|nr:30S ribosome-binding factor RbfA [Sedimentibacter sp. MB36-C1]WSI04263.1 30S ribosome-binding factor RbfA [Sedimentibacter sp. MB36-C1]
MSNKRNSRLPAELKRVISEVIRNNVKDPRISELMSVTDVRVTEDLKFAKVYISVYGDSEPTLEALKSARGYIRREVGRKIKIRNTPELIFVKDDSIEKGIYMNNLINKVLEEEGKKDVDKTKPE